MRLFSDPYIFVWFAVLLVAVILLSWRDRDIAGWSPAAWGSSAVFAFIALGYRGIPPVAAAQLAASVYLGAILGTGFRPGLMILPPWAAGEKVSAWVRVRILGGWIGVGMSAWWIGIPAVEPYYP